jgi:AcrR family transcriptional regulator
MTNDSVKTSGTKRVQQKAETRDRVLAAAVEVFMRGSIVTTPMEAVAKAAGVSKATLFFHFGSRTELLEAIGVELWLTGALSLFRPAEPGLGPALRDYFAAQREPIARLLWEVGDVLSVGARSQGPDVAYRWLICEIDARLAEDDVAGKVRATLSRLLAPAALSVARRAAFGQADDDEVQRFLTDVDAIQALWIKKSR